MTEMARPEEGPPNFNRADGVTKAERYLKRLCDRTFLSLWSHAAVYRDQCKTKPSGDGKEVCDLLVVFEDHIIIFSDKDCKYPATGDPLLDWCRWYRRAVEASAKQVWGAERWIRQYPDRLFSDRACTIKFPNELPPMKRAKFHRVIVAHDASHRCRAELGGSGSLMLVPSIIGPMHCDCDADFSNTVIPTVTPFAIGQVDPEKGFIHVLDDTTLDIILKTRDTIYDFVDYLSRKEAFIASGRLLSATGEEDLLAYYLKHVNDREEHDFIMPSENSVLMVQEDLWREFARSDARKAQLEADTISYLWDELIERFSYHFMTATSYQGSSTSYQDQEKILRFFAREPRLYRRMLAKALIEAVRKGKEGSRFTRYVAPSRPGDPYYVFLILEQPDFSTYEQYRLVRANLLQAICNVVKLKFPDALDIVGFATEPGLNKAGRSEDAVYLDARHWTEEDRRQALEDQKKLEVLESPTLIRRHENEYPQTLTPQKLYTPRRLPPKPSSVRNSLCQCGSGRKFKRCCGLRH